MATVAFQPDIRLPDGEVLAPPPTNTDPNPCIVCGVGKRAGSGILTRCLNCIRLDAQRARDSRAAAEARVAARVGGPLKACRTCRRSKSHGDFGKNARSKDGLRRDCRHCVTAGKVERTKPAQSREAKARDRARRRTPEYRAQNLAAAVAWQTRNAEAVEARKAVSAAKKSGALVPPRTCQVAGCRKRSKLHAHHNRYQRRYWLKVAWLCHGHHQSVHAGMRFKLKAAAAYRTAYAPETA